MAQRPGQYFLLLSALIIASAGCSGPRDTVYPSPTADESGITLDSTVVAIYGDHVLRTDELVQEYKRNSNVAESDSPEDFLDRFVKFRLKVLAAESSGYHKDPSVQEEIQLYRSAFARPYLIDREVLAPILLDLYEKKKQAVHASHIFGYLRPDMSPAESLQVYNRIEALRDSVLQGMNFGEVAFKYSEDPVAANPEAPQGYRGDLGWFSAGKMIKEFEDQAYSTPIGEPSETFVSDFGYHIVMVHDRKVMRPIRLSQILVRINGTAPESLAVAREKIERAKARLDAGQNFAFVANEMSEDEGSRPRGGDVGFITYDNNYIDTTLKRLAFDIKDIGDVTDILHTGYGFQILKLTDRDVLGTYEEEFESLRREARNLPRMLKAEEALAAEARSDYNASLNTTTLLSLVKSISSDSVRAHLSAIALVDTLNNIVIGQVGDSTYTVHHLGLFTADSNNRARKGLTPQQEVLNIGNAFLDYAAITQKAMELQGVDEEFAWIMQNFRDGLLLFRLMQDSVWTRASTDTTTLENLYETKKEQHWFPDRHRIMEVFSYDAATHEAAIVELDEGMSWPDFYDYVRKDSILYIRFDTVMVEGPASTIYDRALNLEPGTRTEAFAYRNGFMALFYDGIEPARQKTFEEARAEIVTHYQAILEEQLLDRLWTHYNVQVFPERARRALLNQ